MPPQKAPSGEERNELRCDECGEPARTTQGLAGHRRLAHRLKETGELDEKASELGVREERLQEAEADLDRRRTELEKAGPEERGMLRCSDCGSWAESTDHLQRHRKSVHPIENAIAGELGVLPEKITSVWYEAARKQERHPNEAPEQIVRRFWDRTDREILSRLLARSAAFRISKEED
jgi:hypothetical protein